MGFFDVMVLYEMWCVYFDVVMFFCLMVGNNVFCDLKQVCDDVQCWFFEFWCGCEFIGLKIEIMMFGCVEGCFMGGNFSLFVVGFGVLEVDVFFFGILFLEDIIEELYCFDGFVMQFWCVGCFVQVMGIVFGFWYECGDFDFVYVFMWDEFQDIGVFVLWEQGFGYDLYVLIILFGVDGVLDVMGDELCFMVG